MRKKTEEPPHALTVRVEQKLWKPFAVLIALNGDNATNLIQNFVISYIKKHASELHDLKDSIDNL